MIALILIMKRRTLQSKARRYKPSFFKSSHRWVSSPWSKTDVHREHLYDTRVTRFLPGIQRTPLSENSSRRPSSFFGTVKDLETYQKIFDTDVRYRLPRPIIDPYALRLFQDGSPDTIFGHDGQMDSALARRRSSPDVDDTVSYGSANAKIQFRTARPAINTNAVLPIERGPSDTISGGDGWVRSDDVMTRRCNPDVDDVDTDSSVLMTDSDGLFAAPQRLLATSGGYNRELQSISRRPSDLSAESQTLRMQFIPEDTTTDTSSYDTDASTVTDTDTDTTDSTLTRTDSTASVETVVPARPPLQLVLSLNKRYRKESNVRYNQF
ncbi:uncharacterized protein LOC118432323 [Branchiostoma floridae]|uniref:Uncharacterized protein LOC118432323 n=1 Tax=Branchiostoma floridae TaxID=7739 RepID=A0A9J7MEH6_BRAFL|nr:uncharacterized protein LOC118432323 [Branchiostoma floridae]